MKIQEAFVFLIDEYGYRLMTDKSTRDGCRLVYIGGLTAVTVLYESRSAYVNVLLHRLINGNIEFDQWPYVKEVLLNNIGLDFIVKYIDESRLAKPLYDAESEYYGKQDAFMLMLLKVADNLRTFGNDVLKGDFSIFKNIDAFVKQHYAKGS